MELHILIRELNGEGKKAVVIYSEAETVPESNKRNEWLHRMLDEAKKQFPIDGRT